MSATDLSRANRRIIVRIAVVLIGMFGFGYALVPLYDLFCDVTGLNGKTGVIGEQAAAAAPVDPERWVTVQFTGNTAGGLPWEFKPDVFEMRVRPGQTVETVYHVHNPADRSIVGRAIPSVAPNRAAAYFKKIECFCFSNQLLEAGQNKAMPVRFVVQPDLPRDVHTITLSYAFFDTGKYVDGHTDKDAKVEGHDDQDRSS